MLKVDLLGRLGNQMFQYAFAYATAKKNNTFFLITPSAPFEVARYFRLDLLTNFFYKYPPYNRYMIRLFSLIAPKIYHKNRIEEEDFLFVDQKDRHSYIGYFQSEMYFKEYMADLEKRFSVKKEFRASFIKKYGSLLNESKIIVVHVRRTDYLEFGKDFLGEKDLSLPMSYYENCLNRIADLDQYKILCISDDIDFVKKNLKVSGDLSFESNDMITDFQLLQHADIAIIANSTFAWWAAYLNKKAQKVFAPKNWLGFKVDREYPVGIIPEKFEAVDVY